jgi:predicted secreted protein
MPVVTAVAMYVVIWWLVLFAVLPFGTRPVADADPASGWRGAPERPLLWRKALMTTLVATIVWAACFALISSGWISFRSGWLALPEN